MSQALSILQNTFGFQAFRPGQEDVVNTLLAGQNVLAVMPTGAGKSLCFQVPALVQGGLTVVVSPLVALMEDQVAALKLAGVEAETINSSRSYDANVAIWRRVAAGQVSLLYISPERLMTGRMISALARLPVTMIAIDEAHCISRWGPSFRPDYEELAKLREHFPDVAIAAMTATADDATQNDIVARLFGGKGKKFVSGFDRPNIRLGVELRTSWKQQLLDFVKTHADESGIVYCLSRKKTEEAALFLNSNGIRALPYHAGMDANDRAEHQDIFMTDPAVVMVATIAFGMGIDKPDVRYVFHANLPSSMEAYYQEIGRAGRDGEDAEVLMLYGLDDIRMRRMFIDQEDTAEDHKRREHRRLDQLIAFCEASSCRRQSLLAYFDEPSQPCGNCDICLNPPTLVDGNAIAADILSVIDGSGQVFGAVHIVDILSAANTDKIRKFNHDKLPGFGAGRGLGKDQLRAIIRQLVAAGYLDLDTAGHGGLSVSEKGYKLARGSDVFRYREEKKSTRPEAEKRPRKTLSTGLSEVDEELYNLLKVRRRELAQERNVPAYVIFADKTLVDMADQKPRNEAAFLEVYGVGKSKTEKFAASFMAVIAEFLGE
ncbi:MAG: DNA helicase RecQ [Rhodospirillales bacterium]|nr:DNA helicase RecQ [Rhodospirillales bacterium]